MEERGLLAPAIKVKDIIAQNAAYHKDVITKHHNGSVLAYVTPVKFCPVLIKPFFMMNNIPFQWNSKGYEIAEKFTNKFEMISPVWLQIKRSPDGTYKISGDHDIDSNWIKRLKKNNPAIKSN